MSISEKDFWENKNINEQFGAFKQAEKYKVIIKLFPVTFL